MDGTVHNTYNGIRVVSFTLRDPEKFKSEFVYEGQVGYYTYCYDMIITPDGTIVCGFIAGEHKYGPEEVSALSPGLYAAVKIPGPRQKWEIRQIDDHTGTVTLNYSPGGNLYAVVTAAGGTRTANAC